MMVPSLRRALTLCGPPTPDHPGTRAPAYVSLYCALASRPAVYATLPAATITSPCTPSTRFALHL